MNAVDISHERRMDRIADQLAGALRQFSRHFGGDRECHVLELPHPADAILRRYNQARPVGPVGAAAVPQRSLGDRQRSQRHDQLDGVRSVALGGIGLVAEVRRVHRALDILTIPQMASWNDFGSTVLLGGIVDRPERRDAEGRARPRNPGAAIVKVPGLYGLARMQIDREHGGQQAALAEFGFEPASPVIVEDEAFVGAGSSLLEGVLVGDAFARPLVDALRTGAHDATGLRFLLTGGAVLSASVKEELIELLPHLHIVDVLGSSETGRQGVHRSTRQRGASTGTFDRSPTAVVLSEDLTRRLEPGDSELGWLAQTGRVPLGYLGDPAKTAKTFPVVTGVRHAVAGDRARLLPDGGVELHGRDSVTINTGGEKVFAEEVEQALKRHPAVFDAVVVGRPSERWGQEVVGVVQFRPGQEDASDDDLRAAAAPHLARYKLPKAFVRVGRIERSPSGKPDYRWAAAVTSDT